MARVSFESLPAYAVVGGVLAGTLVVETDKPLDAHSVTVALRGSECAQVRVRVPTGQNRNATQELAQSVQFLEQTVLPATLGQVGPGTVRLPFSFTIPSDAPPSLSTTPLASTRGRLFHRPDGCFVEYELEGRVEVPWWISPMDRELLPVFSTRPVLGSVPAVRVPADGARPSVSVDADSPAVYPGQPVTGSFQISNPALKHLRSVTFGIQRLVQYSAQQASGEAIGPAFSVTVPIDSKDAARTGRFALAIPNTPEVTGPRQGSLYRTSWTFSVHIDVALGIDVQVSEPLLLA
ncbi:MAG: hypothetical protein L3K06_09130 [Thermoplasmata archaeon]|nr:hypothetical protein [Thermoplasmata archaeon]